MDNFEWSRRLKRHLDTNYSGMLASRYRKLFVLAICAFGLIWLFGFRFFTSESHAPPEPVASCLQRRLAKVEDEVNRMDSTIMYIPFSPEVEGGSSSFLPYVGNGLIGLTLSEDSHLSIRSKTSRTLGTRLPFRPVVRVSVTDEEMRREALVSQYARGIVTRISCIERGTSDSVEVTNVFYAHRTHPSIFEQVIAIRNPGISSVIVQFDQLGWTGEPQFHMDTKRMQYGDVELNYISASGVIEADKKSIVVAVAYKKVPNAVDIKPSAFVSFRFVTVVNYAHVNSESEIKSLRASLEDKSEKELKETMDKNVHTFQTDHERAWAELWTTGFYLSPSRATGALNGDKINATMYYVLSQVRAPLQEVSVSPREVADAKSVLVYSEGCYGGHHTLQAPSLWSSLGTEADVLAVSHLWLLTLEKMGCHHLLRAGASGVMQGMVLSFGALKFSNQHLEFNTEPKDLHRDYHFRRIWYGNATHVNVSVAVGSDNKASLYVALDRSDKEYFACDAGCLDSPIQLGQQRVQFPVKLTDPVTSILYITSDRAHVEELRLSIHVKEVLEAPAHEHHVISMHKHGSGYGTMSTMFWVSISLLIVLFHLFLFHLVYTEYFGTTHEKYRVSRKVSDF